MRSFRFAPKTITLFFPPGLLPTDNHIPCPVEFEEFDENVKLLFWFVLTLAPFGQN
jgi:hypothetical protein